VRNKELKQVLSTISNLIFTNLRGVSGVEVVLLADTSPVAMKCNSSECVFGRLHQLNRITSRIIPVMIVSWGT